MDAAARGGHRGSGGRRAAAPRGRRGPLRAHRARPHTTAHGAGVRTRPGRRAARARRPPGRGERGPPRRRRPADRRAGPRRAAGRSGDRGGSAGLGRRGRRDARRAGPAGPGADVDGGALHAAAGSARPELVRLLVDAGADVDRREPDTGRSPLHAAVAAGAARDAPEVVRVLLDAGADVDATTNDGASALDITRVAAARSRRDDAGQATAHDALAALLVARGATA
ncbi:ankyrin repeat domain-containing protein [Geodermatophilus sp. TF02-6]|uniref:ankyrin repeat domain-containing protein n=1 Tax=Geodermatophilus sp. TF02-6 TaxID=2250575 RepID=UPI001F4766D7|nr:ankyrin repeat domain-containing protein [Geodermatophilus sp. TF02-6]